MRKEGLMKWKHFFIFYKQESGLSSCCIEQAYKPGHKHPKTLLCTIEIARMNYPNTDSYENLKSIVDLYIKKS
jgi:hypothetical protein